MADQNEAAGRVLVDRFLMCSNRVALGWVYVIVSGSGSVKIGSAKGYQGVRRQITSAQTWAEHGILDVRLIHGGHAWEHALHERFTRERVSVDTPWITSKAPLRSEWFKGPAVQAWVQTLTLDGLCEACMSTQMGLFGEIR